MAMFGAGFGSAYGGRYTPPYAPTPEEQDMAFAGAQPGAVTPMQPAGMFGSGLKRLLAPAAPASTIDGASAAGQGTDGSAASAAQGGSADTAHYAPTVNLDTSLPTAPLDTSAIASTPLDLSNAKATHPGFFHHGGLGEKILSGLGEFGLQLSASQGNQYAMSVLQHRYEQQQFGQEAMLKLQQAANQQAAERNEWVWRENYKADHPDDQFTRYMTAAGIDPASPQGQAMYRQRAETMAAPPLMAVDGFDAQNNPTKTFLPRPTFGTSGGAQPTVGPPVGTLRRGFRFKGGNPKDRSSWEPVGGASPAGDATFPAAVNAMIGQESNGRVGAIGPETPYGRALGSTQMLPATAKSMADKLGLPWRPELMTAGTKEAAAYQRALGEAYLREGITTTGNLRDGLRYYHAGPNRRLWGPKTNAYADAVIGRMGA